MHPVILTKEGIVDNQEYFQSCRYYEQHGADHFLRQPEKCISVSVKAEKKGTSSMYAVKINTQVEKKKKK